MYGTTPSRGHGRRTPSYLWQEKYRTSPYPARRRRQRADTRIYHDGPPSSWNSAPFSGSYDPVDIRYESNFMVVLAVLAAPLLLGGAVLSLAVYGLAKLYQRAHRSAVAVDLRTRRALRSRRAASRHAPPTPEALLDAWECSRDSLEGRILLGALLQDLEPAVDNAYIRDAGGEIIGRNPGLRGWLRENCPELSPRYKTLMRYKALADKFLRACGLTEPWTAEDLIPDFTTTSTGDSLPAPVTKPTRKAAPPSRARRTAEELLREYRSLRALDDELWRRLGLMRMARGPRRDAS
jgi:hypothetical protein